MEEKEGLGFNKRRAEGRDKSGKPKTLQLKMRKLNPVNTICYVQILGTGMDTQDTSPSVLLFFDKQRFIFNAGEGLQRFCTEHKIKLSKINIWGPSDLNYLVDAMRSFIPNAAMVHTHSFGVTQDGGANFSGPEVGKSIDPIVLIEDEVVRISAIPLRPRSSKNTVSLDSETGSALKPGEIAVIYACELPEIKGKFDPDKAASLGLRPGPKYRELQLGNSVMSDRLNIMVHPSDVLGPSSPGPIVLLVDCPTPLHIFELLSVQSLNPYYADSADQPRESLKTVNCIIHLGPASVTRSVDYQRWMKKFGSTQHIMAGHEIRNMELPILKSSARISSRLNYLCPQFFPAHGFWSLHQINNFSFESNESCEDSSTPCESISAENLLKFHLRPYSQLGLDRSVIPCSLNYKEIVDELLSEIPEIADVSKCISRFWQSPLEDKLMMPRKDENIIMVEEPWMNENSLISKQGADGSKKDLPCLSDSWTEKLKHNPDIPACLENVTREDMEIILLGTGSSQPSKYRNVSSIFVNLFSRGSLLLDCGEGTLAQLKRRFGVKGADDAVKSLKCIWISHIHADHHTGLARILALRSQLLKGGCHEPLLVIGPRPLKRFLDAYSRLEDLDMQFLDCRHTTEASMDAFLNSCDSAEDCSSEHSDNRVNGSVGVETVTPCQLETNLFAQSSRMQSYWKRPGSPVDVAMALPVLMRLKEVLSAAGLEALYSVPVVHCLQAFGVILKAAERVNSVGKVIPGWKLVYSGDTRPCQALIDASRDATVLIHEATFEDSMGDEAIARNHSTTREAVGVGTSADAYRIILTHFSQRYPKIPVFDETHMHKTCIAFDLMSINLVDLPVLPKVLPYLKVLFRNETVVDESDDVNESVLY
ncbi:tRNAse Z TRZ4, mitochondrial [Cocos nucifera]|uniref:ribonuclease Z n=1 Tax=Cocos nucifera TaxID=13894 RepID=A0A8K0MZ06_COCNU|nr:tRNAse Z TRZ4, mitochondrial [Cocos nucifera]